MSKQTDPEIWRPISSVPGYLASSHGRLMKVPYLRAMPNGAMRSYGGQPTKGVWSKTDNRYILVINGHCHKVARLVCEAFRGPAPADRNNCLHGDENSRNNRPENLSWGTRAENMNAPGFLAYCRSRTGENSPSAKAAAKRRERAA